MLVAPFPVAGVVHTAPLFSVTSPVNVIARAVPLVDAKLMVPEILVAPVTVRGRLMVTIPPALIVKAPKLRVVPVDVAASLPPFSTTTVPVTVQFAVVVMIWVF